MTEEDAVAAADVARAAATTLESALPRLARCRFALSRRHAASVAPYVAWVPACVAAAGALVPPVVQSVRAAARDRSKGLDALVAAETGRARILHALEVFIEAAIARGEDHVPADAAALAVEGLIGLQAR